MLERGGHAVDAAIAANAVLGVVEPEMNGIGGDLFAIVSTVDDGKLHGLNAGGWSPSNLSAANLRSDGFVEMPAGGIHSVTVPGAVAGWEALHTRFGRLSLADDLAPAIFYADEGFPVSDVIADRWTTWTDKLASDHYARDTYLPHDRAPKAGEVFRNPDLARSLRLIATNGRAGFYDGATGAAIVALMHLHGGAMTADDLVDYEPEWVKPISANYRGWDVYELPPNTQGLAALQMLNLMEQFPLRQHGLHSADALHLTIEAKKLAYADMLRYVGDPRFCDVPLDALLDKSYAKERARLIRPRAASRVEPSVLDGVTNRSGGDTIYLSAIDRDGNIVSLIQSIYHGFGCGLVPPGTGFALQNRGALFSLDERHPNCLQPRKRPLHTIIPAYMQRGDVRIGFGIMGGWNQAQAHAQFVADIVDYGMDIQQALEAGRFTKPTFDGTDVFVEALVPESTCRRLVEMGHDVTVIPPRTKTFGSGQAVMSVDGGVHFGASEPRHDGAAIPEGSPLYRPSE
jgi:gamma-glutamyltranspeptidase/glutathione hydrolase